MIVEIACNNFQSCMNAYQAGANRIELFENLAEGGCTPSYGMISRVKKEIRIPVYVMIRPRGGDFVYSLDEIALMREDIAMCKELGVDGIVLGILNPEGQVAVDHCADLLQLWGNKAATFHRAFDRTVNLHGAAEDIINLGFERILTSGGHKNVSAGKSVIQQLQRQYGSEIIFMPGAGVTPQNARDIAAFCGTSEIHATCKVMATHDVKTNEHFSDTYSQSDFSCIQALVQSFQ